MTEKIPHLNLLIKTNSLLSLTLISLWTKNPLQNKTRYQRIEIWTKSIHQNYFTIKQTPSTRPFMPVSSPVAHPGFGVLAEGAIYSFQNF